MARRDPIDEVWELLEAGEIDKAEAACARADLKADEPEEILLCRAAIAAARDEVEQALELLDEAADALPDDPRPLLQAAELELHGREDAAAAIALCERALDVADGEEELADALLLKAEAELSAEDDVAARASLAELDGVDLGDASLWVRAGQLHFAIESDAAAERAFRAAVEAAPGDADALHGLGMIYELRGDRKAMISAWLDTRRIDLEAPAPPWHLSAAEFEAVAEAAMGELPARVVELLENVPILIDDVPSEDLVREGQDPRLLGLFAGVPLPSKGSVGAAASLDSIHLFQRNLERGVGNADELADEIRITLLHETAHFFGLEDDDLEAIGLG
jgi:predicted Zn-dependent protease with MMP-like domain